MPGTSGRGPERGADDLGAVVGPAQADPVLVARGAFERGALVDAHRVTLQGERHRAVLAEERPVGGVDGDEVALGDHVAADQVGDALPEEVAHELGADRRVVACRPRVERRRDVVHEPGDLQLDVGGGVVGEQRRALQVVRERGHDVVGDVLVVEHGDELVDGPERVRDRVCCGRRHASIVAPA